jgi:hypothetical protein
MKLLERYWPQLLAASPPIASAVPVDFNEIGKWYFEEAEIEQYDMRANFPTLVSPWPVAFYEYKAPTVWKVYKDGKWVNRHWGYGDCHVALYLRQFKVEPTYDGITPEEAADLAQIKQAALGQQLKFVQIVDLYLGNKQHIQLPCGLVTYLDDNGVWMGASTKAYDTIKNKEELESMLRAMAYPFWFGISLLHCKNVKTVDECSLPPKLVARRQKQGQEIKTWKKIVIEPLRSSIRRGEHGKGNGVSLAIRLARGHWKSYTEGKGLFGRLHGRWWWDDIACASTKIDTKREYQVKMPVQA